MTTLSADTVVPARTTTEPPPSAAAEPALAAVPPGNPALLGLPTFLPSGLTLGLWLVGYLDTATNGGGMIPIVFFSAGLFLAIATVWATRVGQSAVAGIFGTFSAFWMSFGVLLMGLTNGWYGLSADAATAATQVQNIQATYVLSFLLVFVVLTLSTLRLPRTFTLGFVLVVLTFVGVLAFVLTGSATWSLLAGITCFGFCAVFAYIFVDAMTQELGGRALPLGAPLQG